LERAVVVNLNTTMRLNSVAHDCVVTRKQP